MVAGRRVRFGIFETLSEADAAARAGRAKHFTHAVEDRDLLMERGL